MQSWEWNQAGCEMTRQESTVPKKMATGMVHLPIVLSGGTSIVLQ